MTYPQGRQRWVFSGPIKFNTAKLSTDFTMVSQFSCSFRRKKTKQKKPHPWRR